LSSVQETVTLADGSPAKPATVSVPPRLMLVSSFSWFKLNVCTSALFAVLLFKFHAFVW